MISSNPDFENAVQLLCTIPGVKRDSAITIISEIGTDMTQFSSSKRLCCWAGLTPGSNESAGKEKSVRITRAGVYLKPALVQCAHAAVKSDKSPYYKKKYDFLLNAVARKEPLSLLPVCFSPPSIRCCLLVSSGIRATFLKSICLRLLLKNRKQKLSSKPRNYCSEKDYSHLMNR